MKTDKTVTKQEPIYAYHFLKAGDVMRDGKIAPKIGEKLVYTGKLELCKSGLHASIEPSDALRYAPGSVICKVLCEGKIIRAEDKLICSERTIITKMDGTELLKYAARVFALSVIDKWDAPDVVLDWLMTGEEDIRWAAAEAAAYAAYAAAADAAKATATAEAVAAYAAADAADAAYAAAAAAADAAYAYAAAAAAAYANAAAYAANRDFFNSLVKDYLG
jgi:hypothetical protein